MTTATREPGRPGRSSLPDRAVVLCVGITPCIQRTLTFPRFSIHAVNRARAVSVGASGKGTNVCRALLRLGDAAELHTMAGGGTGEQFLAMLEAEGMPVRAVRVAGATRICQTLVDESGGEVTELVEEMPSPSEDEWDAFEQSVASRLPDAAALLLSGKLPPGSPSGAYARLASLAAEHGVPVCIDSQQEPLLLAVRERPLLVKINAEEVALTTREPDGSHAGLRAGIDRIRSAGAEWVLITRGPRPAVLVGPDGSWRYRIPELDPINPIGSGDSVLAGTVRGMRLGQPLPEAVRLGLAAGCANALTPSPAEFERASANALQERIEMETNPWETPDGNTA